MRLAGITLALLVLPLPAAAQDMCAALKRIEAAAGEAPAFASLDGPGQELVPGYGPHCRVADTSEGRILFCSRGSFAPAGLVAETMGPIVRDCLGAERLSRARPMDFSLRYGTAALEVTVRSHCNERCHVGRSASISFRRRDRQPVQATDSR